MSLNNFYDLIEKLKDSYENSNMDYTIFGLNIVLLLIIFCFYYDIKVKELFTEKKFLALFAVNSCLMFILQLMVGNLALFLPVLSFFGVNLLMYIKSRETFRIFSRSQTTNEESDNTSSVPNSTRLSSNTGISEDMTDKMSKLGKNTNFNILDVLFIYDYISDYQRRKVIQSLICESTDKMADKLLTIPTITEEELNEARAILNLIGLEGRIVTKEEAIMCLLKNKKGEGENND